MSAAPVIGGKRLVRCQVGSEMYCLDSEWLDSIQVMENLYPSRSADGSIGWIRRFDEKVPVFRLADQIYGTASKGPSRHGVIMVLRRKDRLWALLVDKVMAAGEVAQDSIFPLPPVVGDSNGGKFPGVLLDESGIMLYLAPDRVVPGSTSGAPAPERRAPEPAPVSRVRAAMGRMPAEPSGTRQELGSPAPRKAAQQIITFTLVHETPLPAVVRFAVSAGQAVEIVSELPMIPVPNAPSFVMGLARWRNLPVPVVDLGAWFGITPAPFTPGARFLLCRGTVGRSVRDAGLLAIPAVDDIRKLDLPIEYKPWPDEVPWNAALALGIYRAERAMMVVPDLDAILSFHGAEDGYRM